MFNITYTDKYGMEVQLCDNKSLVFDIDRQGSKSIKLLIPEKEILIAESGYYDDLSDAYLTYGAEQCDRVIEYLLSNKFILTHEAEQDLIWDVINLCIRAGNDIRVPNEQIIIRDGIIIYKALYNSYCVQKLGTEERYMLHYEEEQDSDTILLSNLQVFNNIEDMRSKSFYIQLINKSITRSELIDCLISKVETNQGDNYV